jgi:hypothetical protein
LGPLLAGKAATAAASGSGSQSLTGRLENLTLVRAAGAASSLPPEAAVIAYGASAAVTVFTDRAVELAAHRARRRRGAPGAAAGAGGGGLAALTDAERHELIVRRYLLTQLKAAEEARRAAEQRRKAALKFAVNSHRAAGLTGAAGTLAAVMAGAAPATTAPGRGGVVFRDSAEDPRAESPRSII